MFSAAILNRIYPADRNATSWVVTKDGCWTRQAGRNINPEFEPTCVCGEIRSMHHVEAFPIKCHTFKRDR